MISKLTEEQRAEIRNARGAEVDSRGSRKRKREERKRLRVASRPCNLTVLSRFPEY